jgi:short-subunit dehydrogenase
MNWQGKVALITGASSGVGLSFAKRLSAAGASVALVARQQSGLEAAARQLPSEQVALFALDVGDRERLLALPRRVAERFGGIDLVVNNAGVNHRGAFQSRSAANVAQILDVNLVAPLLLTHAALPFLSRGAAVINVASLAGKVPVPHEATYSATKAGLRAFSRALAHELEHIRVLTVCPGPIQTPFLAEIDAVPNMVFSQPISTADEVADAALHALEQNQPEVDVPKLSGKLATLGYLFPSLMRAAAPLMELRGAMNKRKYLRAAQQGV